MAVPRTIKAEYLRAVAAEAELGQRLDALEARLTALSEPPPPPPPPAPAPAPPPVSTPSGIPVPPGTFASAIAGATGGQTLLVESQTIAGATYLSASGVTVVGNPTGAVIRPSGRPNGLFVKGSRTTVRGLDFVGEPSAPDVYNDANGSALLEVLAVDAPVEDTLIEAVSFDLPAGAGARQHGLYVAGDVRRLIARRVTSRGRASEGGRADGLTGWHDGTAPAQDIVFEDWLFDDHYNAVVYWLATATVTFRRCTFLGTLNSDIQVDTGGQVIVEGCRGSKGIIATSSIHPGTVVVDRGGNDWSWTP